MQQLLITLCIICTSFQLFAQDWKKVEATDRQGLDGAPFAYAYPEKKPYKGVEKQSMYITMRDGVHLAIDIYLPKNRKKGDKFPTLLHQTRYWRSPQLRFPFRLLSNGLLGRMGNMIETFVEQGYVIVNVDVRGSGASFGTRKNPWTEDEVKDGVEIMEWILKQEWSTDKIGSLGVSYGGTTAEFLATQKHPSLKAVVLMFSLFDIYEDNAFPGGIHNRWFTFNWGSANELMDNNMLPPNAEKYKWLIKGVSPVKKKKKILPLAVDAHVNNQNVHTSALLVDSRDDALAHINVPSVDEFSPHAFVKELNASGTAVYSYSGWFDGAYQHAAIKRHLNLDNPMNKLMLGPWEHGGALNCSPSSPSKAGFDHTGELLKFFDYHLKGKKNGLYDEPRVHYFSMIEDKWKGTDVWPIKEAKEEKFYLNGNRKLTSATKKVDDYDRYYVDTTAGMGEKTAWKAVNGKIKTPYTYTEWNEGAKKYLFYTSTELEEDKTFTGHPIMSCYVSLENTEDASVFAYLEDVAPDGTAQIVTHGQLRVLHRKVSNDPIYKDVIPTHTYLSKDAEVLKEGEVGHLLFDLLPTSYQFKKGHRIRISFSGADRDHFELINKKEHSIKFHFGPSYPSNVTISFE